MKACVALFPMVQQLPTPIPALLMAAAARNLALYSSMSAPTLIAA